MADPLRLRILMALTTALAGITPANGYQHDLTGKVFRGRSIFSEDDPIPMVSILEAIEQEPLRDIQMPTGAGVVQGPWDLLVQGFVEDDPENPTDPAHRLMADVKKRLAAERLRSRQRDILQLGNAVTDIVFSPGIVRPADEVSNKAYFWLRVRLSLVENLMAPYP